MERRMAMAFVLVAVVGMALLPTLALAADLGTGAAIDVSALDDALATTWNYIKGPAGKVIGAALAAFSLAKVNQENNRSKPIMGVAAGAGIAFVPPIISTSFEAVAAAPFGVPTVMPGLFALARDGFLGWRLSQDIVFYVALGIALYVLVLLRQRQRRTLAMR